MNRLKTFNKFVTKEFTHILRDKRTLYLLLIFPAILVMTFGYALTVEVKDVRLIVATAHRTPTINRLISRLDASNDLIVTDIMNPSTNLDNQIKANKADAIIIIPNHFEKDLINGTAPGIQIRLDASDSNGAMRILVITQGIIYRHLEDFYAQLMPPSGVMPEQSNLVATVDVNTELLYNPEMKASYFFVPGVMGIILMIVCSMMTSISIVREKESGSMEMLLTSPVHPITILISKMIPYFFISFANIVSILLLSKYQLGVPINGPFITVLFVSILFTLVALSLGLLISNITNDQTVAMMISGAGLLLPVAVLSGMFFPIESIPNWLITVTHAIPAKWYITAMKKLMIQGVSSADIIKEAIILIVMIATLLIIGLRTFKLKMN